MLKIFYPKAILVMQNDRMHCATLIDGEIYDITEEDIKLDKKKIILTFMKQLELI